MFASFSTAFAFSQIMFFVVFFIVICVFGFVIFTSISRWRKNEKSPRLTVSATIVSKRAYHSSGRTGHMHHHGTTSYYVTFEVESGDRMELPVYGEEYGLLVEGDRGQLTFQGTRYLSFQRN